MSTTQPIPQPDGNAYVVTDRAGRVIRPGDVLTGRGEPVTFYAVTRPPRWGKSARVQVDGPHGPELYAHIFGLTVTESHRDASVIGQFRADWPGWSFGTHWSARASGPDAMSWFAVCRTCDCVVTALSAPGLRVELAGHRHE